MVLPPGWHYLDLDPSRTQASVRWVVERQFAGQDDAPLAKARVREQLEQLHVDVVAVPSGPAVRVSRVLERRKRFRSSLIEELTFILLPEFLRPAGESGEGFLMTFTWTDLGRAGELTARCEAVVDAIGLIPAAP